MPGLTRLELTTRVQALGYGSDVATHIHAAINAAQNRVLAIRRWPFMESSISSQLLAGTGSIALPHAVSTQYLERVDAVWLASATAPSTERIWVEWVPPDQFRRLRMEDERERSTPEVWTRYGNQILFYPLPDITYNYTVEGVLTPIPLASDGSQTHIPTEYGEVLVWGAVEWLAFRQRDWAARQVAEELFAKHLNAMLTAYVHDQRQNAGEVGRWEGWNDVSGRPSLWLT